MAYPPLLSPTHHTHLLPPPPPHHHHHQVLDNSWELGGMRLQPAGDTASPASASVADLGPGTQRVCMHHLVRREGDLVGEVGGSGGEGRGREDLSVQTRRPTVIPPLS